MNINLSLSAAPGITVNYLVVAIYDSTAPATVVASQSFAAPHAAPRNITFTNLNPNVYIVKTYESVDGTPSGVVRHQFIYDPTFGFAQVRLDEILIVGQTAGLVAGATQYIDATLDGWKYSIERRGSGTMINLELNPANAEAGYILGGGFELLVAGDQFGNGEIFILHFLPIISNAAPSISQTAGVLWSGVKDITDNATGILVAGDMGKYCIIAGTGPVLDIVLPGGDEVVDGTMIGFLSDGGVHIAANIKPKGTDQLTWSGDVWTNADPFSICQGEEVWLAYHTNAWRVMMADGGWKDVGDIVTTYTKQRPNVILGDGNLYTRAQYPRLWRWINQKLAAAILVTDATWLFRQDSVLNGNPYHFYPNVGKFSTGNNTTTFRMCLLYRKLDANGNLMAGGYLRGVDGATEIAATQNIDGVGIFTADISGKIIGVDFVNAVVNKVLVLDNYGNGGSADYGGGVTPDVPFTGKNPLTGVANGETKPFTTNAYLYLKF